MTPFLLGSSRTPDSLRLTVEGYLNDLAAEAIEREVERAMADGITKVVIDFTQAGMVNSIGVSILVGAVDMVRKKGGAMVFAGVSTVNREIFEMVGIGPFVSFVDDWEEPL